MEPNKDNGGRWNHVASDHEIREFLRVANANNSRVVELPQIGITILGMQSPYMMIVRSAAMGGGVNNLECGWVYDNPFSLELDWREINSINKVDT